MPYIMLIHWIADFLCQSRWMAENKSKSLAALSAHVGVYLAVLGVASIPMLGLVPSLKFALLNGVLHFAVDFCTSRATSYFYQKQNTYAFFATVGFDQYLHFLCLWWTLDWIRLAAD